MTNEEAKVFLDNLKICINEHPVVADWLVEVADRKTELQIDCQDCKYVWWNSEAKRYECQIEKCPYSQKTENSSEKPNNCEDEQMETQTETQNSNLTFDISQTDCGWK